MNQSNPANRVATPFEGGARRAWNSSAIIPAPLCLYQPTVLGEWVDYNGHMSESCYLLVFGNNSDAFFRYFGIDEQYRAAGHSLYTVETHLHNLREAAEHEPLKLTLQLLDVDSRRLHILHAMYHAIDGGLLATAEQMLVHVDMNEGKSAPLPLELFERLQAIHAAHAALPVPKQVGHVIGIRRG